MSSAFYDAMLNDWDNNNVETGVAFHAAGGTKYSIAGEEARNNLIARSWTFTDGGKVEAEVLVQADFQTLGIKFPISSYARTVSRTGQTKVLRFNQF